MKKIIIFLLVFVLGGVLPMTSVTQAKENKKDKDFSPVCQSNSNGLDLKHMAPMFSADELINIAKSYSYAESSYSDPENIDYHNKSDYCQPQITQNGKYLVFRHDDIHADEGQNEEFGVTRLLDAYDSNFYVDEESGDNLVLNVFVPRVWYTNVDENPSATDTISVAYKQYINAIQIKVLQMIFESGEEKPVVKVKVYDENNDKNLLTTATFPKDGKVTQKLLMGKESEIKDRTTNDTTLIDGVVSVKKVGMQKKIVNNLDNTAVSYHDSNSGINVDFSTYNGGYLSGNYDFSTHNNLGFVQDSDFEVFNNKYKDISKSYKKLKKKFEKEAKKQGMTLVNSSKVKVTKYYVAYQNKYKLSNGEYKLEYTVLFNRDADQVKNKGELFSKLSVSMQGNQKYLSDHTKEFNDIKKSIKLFKTSGGK